MSSHGVRSPLVEEVLEKRKMALESQKLHSLYLECCMQPRGVWQGYRAPTYPHLWFSWVLSM
jgi:hypothetical protein